MIRGRRRRLLPPPEPRGLAAHVNCTGALVVLVVAHFALAAALLVVALRELSRLSGGGP